MKYLYKKDMKIHQIINEEINKFLLNNISENTNDSSKDEVEKAKRRDGKNVSTSDEDQIRYDVNNADLINVAALAREVYPDHTPEGAQSQLRKKLKGIKNDNGSEYHIKQREASAIRKALNNI